MPKIVPESIQTCFERVLGQIFRKFFCSVFRGGSSFRKISKFLFKIPKMPKSVPKSIQTRFGRVWGKLSENFCPVFHGMSSLQKFSKKKIFKIPKMPKSVPKRIQTCFRVIFSKKFNAQCSMEGRVFENFQKKSEKFQNSKIAQNFCQKYPNVF